VIPAVLDRIENDTAVLLLEKNKGTLLCPVDVLPDGCRPGTWLMVELEHGQVSKAELNPEKTEETLTRVKSKLDLLRQRGRTLP